jgi:hypothetical protein
VGVLNGYWMGRMADELSDEQLRSIHQVAEAIWSYCSEVLKEKVDQGLISEDLSVWLLETFPHHDPSTIEDPGESLRDTVP